MKLGSIQALRGLAALLIVLSGVAAVEATMIAQTGALEPPLIASLWANGQAGIDLFIVISGFTLVFVAGQAAPAGRTATAFLFSRLARVFPLWWIMVGLYVACLGAFKVSGPDGALDYPALDAHLAASLALWPQPQAPFPEIGWPLIHGVYFYFGFACLLLTPRPWRPAITAIWAGGVAAGAAAGLSSAKAEDIASLIFHPLTLEFLAGALAGMLFVAGRRWRPGLMTLLGAGALAYALVKAPTANAHFLEWGRILWFGGPSVLLVYGLAGLDIAGRIKPPASLTDLGNWSYACYLSHILSVSAAAALLEAAAAKFSDAETVSPLIVSSLQIGAPGVADNLLFLTVALILTILTAWIIHRFVEKPILKLAGRLRGKLFWQSEADLRPRPIRSAIW